MAEGWFQIRRQRRVKPSLQRGQAKDHRVVRGGSWNNNQNNARCAYRNRNEPDNWNNNIGFRIVVAHTLLFSAGNAARQTTLGGRGL
jgi:formylglycine-generating enzyme required for sulfatase activity